MSTKQVLVVEDDEPKLRALVAFLQESYPSGSIDVTEARSHSSATKALDTRKFDLALLDMSLPSFDLDKDTQGGGPPQGFGGRELLRLLEAEAPETFAVVVTQYPDFAEAARKERASFDELRRQLKDEFGSQFLGMLYYSGKQGPWRQEMKSILDTLNFG